MVSRFASYFDYSMVYKNYISYIGYIDLHHTMITTCYVKLHYIHWTHWIQVLQGGIIVCANVKALLCQANGDWVKSNDKCVCVKDGE